VEGGQPMGLLFSGLSIVVASSSINITCSSRIRIITNVYNFDFKIQEKRQFDIF
jgi:hypothetical protein